VHFTIIVDQNTVEAFIDDGETTHSNLAFPDLNDTGITLFTENGTAVFENLKIKHMRSSTIKQQRRPSGRPLL
jgi:levanbiose-producing levanase